MQWSRSSPPTPSVVGRGEKRLWYVTLDMSHDYFFGRRTENKGEYNKWNDKKKMTKKNWQKKKVLLYHPFRSTKNAKHKVSLFVFACLEVHEVLQSWCARTLFLICFVSYWEILPLQSCWSPPVLWPRTGFLGWLNVGTTTTTTTTLITVPHLVWSERPIICGASKP